MEIKVMGFKIRPVVVILCILVGMIIGGFALCSCAKITLQQVKEGFDEMGLEYQNNTCGGSPPYANGEMFFFANNKFKPECCLNPISSVSSADGCACVTKNQVDYINMRGGNRTNGIY